MKLDIFDPSDQRLLPNTDYDPTKPFRENGNVLDIVDPLCGWARWGCWWIDLPMLEEKYAAASRVEFFHAALRLIALHQVAPPPWLAAAMLKEFMVMPPSKKIEDARETTMKIKQIQAKRPLSIKAIAELQLLGPHMNYKSKLDRQLRIYREYEARRNQALDRQQLAGNLNQLADKLP